MKQVFILFGICLLSLMACNNGDGFTYAQIETDHGTIKVKLYNSTPQHRDNFVKLANEGFYDGLLFHRVIEGFMIQGGDPESKDAPVSKPLGSGGPGYQIPAEIGGLHIKGALAAARNGNPEKKSSGSQFYLVQGKIIPEAQLSSIEQSKGVKYSQEQRDLYATLGGTPQLDNEYTVFGEIVEGLDVVDKIAAVETQPGDRPTDDVKMYVKILK